MNKQLRKKCVLGALLALVAVGTAQAFTFRFDEWGNGLLDTQPLPGVMWTSDPTGGVLGPVLVYTLPGGLGTGDVRVWEDASQVQLSDVLRFFGDTQNTYMIFYSDQDAYWEPADSGIPAILYPADGGGVVEGADGYFTYFADPHTYIGFSGRDAVPDGGFTVALLGLAMAGLVGMRRSKAV